MFRQRTADSRQQEMARGRENSEVSADGGGSYLQMDIKKQKKKRKQKPSVLSTNPTHSSYSCKDASNETEPDNSPDTMYSILNLINSNKRPNLLLDSASTKKSIFLAPFVMW